MTRYIALCAGALVLFSACASLDTHTDSASARTGPQPGAFVRMEPPTPEEALEGTMSTAATPLPRPTAPAPERADMAADMAAGPRAEAGADPGPGLRASESPEVHPAVADAAAAPARPGSDRVALTPPSSAVPDLPDLPDTAAPPPAGADPPAAARTETPESDAPPADPSAPDPAAPSEEDASPSFAATDRDGAQTPAPDTGADAGTDAHAPGGAADEEKAQPTARAEEGDRASGLDRPLPGPAPTDPAWEVPEPGDALTESTPSASQPLTETLSAGLRTATPVTLPGVGWTYLGNSDAVDYERRVVRNDSTIFTFRPIETGSHELRFERQDLTRGERMQAEITLDVPTQDVAQESSAPAPGLSAPDRTVEERSAAADSEAGTAPAGKPAAEPQGPAARRPPPAVYTEGAGTGNYARAEELARQGRDEEALNEYLRRYDGDPEAAYEIASLADALEAPRVSDFIWQEVATGSGAAAIQAHRILFDRRLAEIRTDESGDPRPAVAAALEHYDELERHGHLPDVESTMTFAEALLADGNARAAQRVVRGAYAPGSALSAEALYLLGRALEAQQLPERAIAQYRELLDNYVLSRYYEPARERYEYLRRHFLHVR